MMYYLHQLSSQFGPLNVFSYVTFRAVAAAVTAFGISLIFGNWVIAKLTALKVGQPIRLAAEVHRLAELHGSKQGTPTMGGVLVIGAVFVSVRVMGASGQPIRLARAVHHARSRRPRLHRRLPEGDEEENRPAFSGRTNCSPDRRSP